MLREAMKTPVECKNCEIHQENLKNHKAFISKMVSYYINQGRKLTSSCLEGSMLLKLNE